MRPGNGPSPIASLRWMSVFGTQQTSTGVRSTSLTAYTDIDSKELRITVKLSDCSPEYEVRETGGRLNHIVDGRQRRSPCLRSGYFIAPQYRSLWALVVSKRSDVRG